mmetsp:Transcript_8662/g.14250  ORF Transcript_8662/g.14250 Transcript_8662/m.14250 type:complete len:461 (+) Transcript_8662:1-1383(+)
MTTEHEEKATATKARDADLIKTGDCVILLDRTRRYQHITVGSKHKQRLNRLKVANLGIVQHKPYGSVFELKSKELQEIASSQWQTLQEQTNLDYAHNEDRDNSALFHHTDNQQLSQIDILKLKADASTFNEETLISKIAESSKTFHLKTEFSKEKYLKSKKAKHTSKFITLKANSCNLAEMYFHRKPEKTLGLRIDSVSQILSLANIHHDQHVLLVESCTGLLVGSVAERMHGVGRIFNVYCEKNPVLEIANSMFYLSAAEMQIVYNVNIGLFNDKLWMEDSEETRKQLEQIVDTNSKLAKFKESRVSLYQIKQWIKFEKCDSLLICCKYRPLALLKHLYRYLEYGSPFVVWSEFVQPLVEIKQWFESNGDGDGEEEVEAVGLKVYENWFREQQVLPQRTHPMVNMQHMGGYILSGTKVRLRPSRKQWNERNAQKSEDENERDNGYDAPCLKKRKLSDLH